MLKNSSSICYIFFATDVVIVTSVNTYTSMMGIGTEDKCSKYLIKSLREKKKKYGAKWLLKMFPNKNWSLGRLKALIKKMTTQVLCGQCEVDHYPIRPTTVLCFQFFTAHRFASAVLAMAMPSVCPSITCQYCVKTMARSTVQFAPSDSKMCLVL